MKTLTETHSFISRHLVAGFFCPHNCRYTLLATSMLGLFSFSNAQSSVEYTVHANIIYHFTKYVNWPENKKAGDFVIGIVGDTPLFEELTKIVVNKTAGHQRIIIRKISPAQQSFDCHILFISEDEAGSLKKIASRIADNPVLLVCEDAGAASRGASINFKVVSERLKLEINKNNIEQRSLSIANELLQLGILVK